MPATLEQIESEVLKLTANERAHLLERLVVSLDTDPEVEAAWAEVAQQREAELDAGAVQAIEGNAAVQRLRTRLS